jgi:hypothetical protein
VAGQNCDPPTHAPGGSGDAKPARPGALAKSRRSPSFFMALPAAAILLFLVSFNFTIIHLKYSASLHARSW